MASSRVESDGASAAAEHAFVQHARDGRAAAAEHGVVARLVDPMKMILLRARRLSSVLVGAAEHEEQMLQSTAWN